MLVKKIVLNKFQVYSLQMQLKFFVCLLGTAILRNNSFVLTEQDHIDSIRDYQSKFICSQFSYTLQF